MTLTVTPEPAHIPPRVRIDLELDAGETISTVSLSRDGTSVREQPYPGGPATTTFDYEAPFGVPVRYDVIGTYLPPTAPDWTEPWGSLAAWSGSGFSVSGGKARSSVTDAQIVRSTSGTIQRLDVTNPSFVRIELLDAADAVVASVQVGVNVIVAGTTSVSLAGGGSFTASLTEDLISVAALDSSWSTSRPISGTPTKVRVVSLGVSYPAGLSFGTAGFPYGVAVDSSGNIYVLEATGARVRKFNSAGTAGMTFSTVGVPRGIAVDSSGNIYVTDADNSLVRKFNSSGTQTLTIPTVGFPYGVAVDSSGNIYVADTTNKRIRKFSSAGVAGTTFSMVGTPFGVAVDSAGNVYAADVDNNLIRKYNPAGSQTLAFGTLGSPPGVALDAAGNIYVTDAAANSIRKFSSTGVPITTFPTVGTPRGVAVDAAGDLYVVDSTNILMRKFVLTTPIVGAIAPTLVTLAQAIADTQTVTLDVDEAWLIHPTFSTLSCSIDAGQHQWRDDGINVDAASKATLSRAARATRHDPSGRRRAVVFTSGSRAAGEWDLRLHTRRLQDRDAVDDLTDDQSPLLLRSPPTWPWDLPDGWYSVGDYTEERPRPRLDQAGRIINLPLTPVSEPIVRLAAVWTFGADLLRNPTFADSRAEFPTFLDRLVGP